MKTHLSFRKLEQQSCRTEKLVCLKMKIGKWKIKNILGCLPTLNVLHSQLTKED